MSEDQPELWEELRVEHHWFHIVRGMIHRGKLREMGPVAWAVYCVIKSHTNLENGEASPGIDRIAELVGVSHDTAERAIKRLVKIGVLEVDRVGRKNHYALLEQVPVVRKAGDVFGFGERRYAPMQFQRFIEDLTQYARSGSAPAGSGITVNVTLNVQNVTQGDGGTVTINIEGGSGSDQHDVKKVLKRL